MTMEAGSSSRPEGGLRPRACERCARSKAKCVWSDRERDGSRVCDRCFHGDAACVALPPGTRKKRGKSTRVKAIEQKLDAVMSLLGEHEGLLHSKKPADFSGSESQASDSRPPVSTWDAPMMDNAQPHAPQASFPPPSTQTSSAGDMAKFEIVPGFEMSLREANQVLQEYTAALLPQFPFVPIGSPDAAQMSRERPLLLKTLLFITSPPNSQAQTTFDAWFRQHIAHQIIVLNTKSIELIQAIAVFLAWRDFRDFLGGLYTGLIQLAMGLITDLKLERCPQTSSSLTTSIAEDVAMLGFDLSGPDGLTNAGRRASLGIFYLGSSSTLLLNRPLYFGYSALAEQSCQVLLRDQEYPTDAMLVQLIKIQRIASKASGIFLNATGDGVAVGGYHAMAISLIRKEIDEFASQLPNELASNYLLQSHKTAILVRLYEPAIRADPKRWPYSPLSRTEAMWTCFQSAITLCLQFLDIPLDVLSSLTFPCTAHLSTGLIKIIKLLRITGDPDWDPAAAAGAVNIEELIQRLSDLFRSGCTVSMPRRRVVEQGQDILSQYADRLALLKTWCSVYLGSGAPDLVPSDDYLGDNNLSFGLEGNMAFWQMFVDGGY